ncbi:MAG: phosphoribosylaminoimidazolesuccinocarboxamide synthase [Deltaproteobacteria bacterium]|nr:phosphoribosylaminoimidazolesuccinocarboxamide synthase [Deltaproteobacteria bacterium]MBN2846010.1 phosphoribosylaminoimidazolesuccinocarboxamide synthase [Deltaproteobacteria bacterium]
MVGRGVATTDFKDLRFISRGKVRDLYEVNDSLLIVATDRISAFDVIMPNSIPGKGKILTQISAFWFREMEDIVENHLISTRVEEFPEQCRPYDEELRERSMLVRKTTPLPVECVVRGYLAGSGWKDYSDGKPVSGVVLPGGLKESSRLSEPIFTPSTKAEEGEHDVPITREELENIIGRELTERVVDISMKIYSRASVTAEKKGIIIADTKMEFGILDNKLILIDELLTPDSSRFWPRDDFEEGRSQKSFDKQFLRDYLLSTNWDKRPPAPELPEDIIEKTKEKYEEALKYILS